MPFVERTITIQYVLNIVMFIPFGLLLPLVWPQICKFWHIVSYGLGFSLIIELSQLITNRATDVDDLIMNVLGALIGFVLFKAIQKLWKRKAAVPPHKDSTWWPSLYLAGMSLGHFFLYDHAGLVNLLFGNHRAIPF